MNIKQYENGLSTAELARQSLATAGSIRVRYCKTGSYFGIRPLKLPNGRLLWPIDSLRQLTAQRACDLGKLIRIPPDESLSVEGSLDSIRDSLGGAQ